MQVEQWLLEPELYFILTDLDQEHYIWQKSFSVDTGTSKRFRAEENRGEQRPVEGSVFS